MHISTFHPCSLTYRISNFAVGDFKDFFVFGPFGFRLLDGMSAMLTGFFPGFRKYRQANA
jgi:hypothetical protein